MSSLTSLSTSPIPSSSSSVSTSSAKDWRDQARRAEREEEKTAEWIEGGGEEKESEEVEDGEKGHGEKEEEGRGEYTSHHSLEEVDGASEEAIAYTEVEREEEAEPTAAVEVEEKEAELTDDASATSLYPHFSDKASEPVNSHTEVEQGEGADVAWTAAGPVEEGVEVEVTDDMSVVSSCPHLAEAVAAVSRWGLRCLSPCLLCLPPQRRQLYSGHLKDARRAIIAGKAMASECERSGEEEMEEEEGEATMWQPGPALLLSLSPTVAVEVLQCLLEALSICDHSAALHVSILLLDAHIRDIVLPASTMCCVEEGRGRQLYFQ